jgi:hypothetical protein
MRDGFGLRAGAARGASSCTAAAAAEPAAAMCIGRSPTLGEGLKGCDGPAASSKPPAAHAAPRGSEGKLLVRVME